MTEYPVLTAVVAVIAFLAPAAVWLYTEFRSRWRDRLKMDFELLKLCREAESAGASLAEIREKIEQSISRKAVLFDEDRRYDWTYAGLAALGVIGAVVSQTYKTDWLTQPLSAVICGLMGLLVLGAVLNFFSGEPR